MNRSLLLFLLALILLVGCDPNLDGDEPGECTDEDGDGSTTCDGDCDDLDPAVSPSALEVCNGLDDDCSGLADQTFDGDADGHLETSSCPGVLGADDCDDDDPAVHGAAPELCDEVDHNCDGDLVAGAVDASEYCPDLDNDGFTSGTSTLNCGGTGWASCSTEDDCDDTDAGVYPGAPEVIWDHIDQDCVPGSGEWTAFGPLTASQSAGSVSLELVISHSGSQSCTQRFQLTGTSQSGAGVLSPDCNACTARADFDLSSAVEVTDSSVNPDDCTPYQLVVSELHLGYVGTGESGQQGLASMGLIDIASVSGDGQSGQSLEETQDFYSGFGFTLSHLVYLPHRSDNFWAQWGLAEVLSPVESGSDFYFGGYLVTEGASTVPGAALDGLYTADFLLPMLCLAEF
jgi:hypothetical protein